MTRRRSTSEFSCELLSVLPESKNKSQVGKKNSVAGHPSASPLPSLAAPPAQYLHGAKKRRHHFRRTFAITRPTERDENEPDNSFTPCGLQRTATSRTQANDRTAE